MTRVAQNKVIHAAVSAIDIRPALAKHRTAAIDDFVFDKSTGEILGSYITNTLAPAPYDYEPPQADNNPAVHTCFELELDPAPCPDAPEIEEECLPDNVVDLDALRSKRGPKPKVTPNPLASYFQVAHAEHHGWIDDYIHGSCVTAGNISNGMMNVNPSHVLRACMLDKISTEIVKKVIRLEGLRMMSDQQARRVCQCARLAIGGMEHYLERNPAVRQQLKFEVDFTSSYSEKNWAPLQTVA